MKRIPTTGLAADDVIGELERAQADDTDWRGGRVFSLVYHAGEAHERLLARAHATYASANLLNPMAFAGLRRIEREIVEMAASLMNGASSTVGVVTSGGTESIMVAMAAYRDRARRRRPWLRRPVVVAAKTVHPAFDKAAHWLGLELRKVDIGADLRADARAIERAIDRRTICVVASAPQYPHGVIDPIAAIGEVAMRKRVPLHVDACVGGFMLPWLEQLGRPVPRWDFRVPAVTSISADLHKYAYAGKGASVLLWRSMEYMKHQFFIATDFPGGIYASPTMVGTRPGGPIAAAWAALTGTGVSGYLELARNAARAADRMRDGIVAIPGLRVLGAPDATIVAWTTAPGTGLDTFAIADRLEARGWAVDRQHRPASVHLTVTANHLAVVDRYLADLRAAVDEVRKDPSLVKSGTAPMYGMAAKLPVRGLVARSVRKMLEGLYARNGGTP